MHNSSAIFLLVILIICLILLIKKCIIERKFYKELLSIDLVLIFTYVMILIFFDKVISNSLGNLIYTFGSYFVLFLCTMFLFYITNNNLGKRAFLNNILESLEDSTYYLLLNKKNKIIEISSLLSNKLGVNKDEVKGLNLSYILNDYITIEKINNKDVSNNEFLLYISSIIPKDLISNLELVYLNKEGNEETLNITEKAIYINDKFYGRMYFNQVNNVEVNTLPQEDDFKFKTIINCLNEGAFEYNFITKTLNVNDYLVKQLNLLGNTVSISDLIYNINKDDYTHIKEILENANRNNNILKTSIEYSTKSGTKVYLKITGNIVFDGLNKTNIIGSVLISDTLNFIPLNSTILNTLKTEDNIQSDVKMLTSLENNFEIVTFKILDIKEINDTYSRQVGTLIIEEYVRSIMNVFDIKDYMYRVTGTRFAFILTDSRQMEKLTRALTNNKLLTPTLNYGHINIKLNVIMGISFNNDSIRKEEIYQNSKYALKKAKEQKKQYIFYRDLLN